MPLNLNNTKTEVIVEKQEVTKQFDTVNIVSHVVDNSNVQITIIYERYMNGVLLDERLNKHIVAGADFMSIAMAMPTPGLNRYFDLKEALYNKLMSDLGLVGTVS